MTFFPRTLFDRPVFTHMRSTMLLAWPLVIAQLIEMSMVTIDTIMVGHLGREALATLAIAGTFWAFFKIFIFGFCAGLSPLIAQTHQNKQPEMAAQWFAATFAWVILLSAASIIILTYAPSILHLFKQQPKLIPDAHDYLTTLSYGIPCFYAALTMRQCFEGHRHTHIPLKVNIIALIINIIGNYALIFGHFGFPAMGLQGASITTVGAWSCSLLGYLFYARAYPQIRTLLLSAYHHFNRDKFFAYFGIGAPLGSAFLSEVSFFVIVTFFIGSMGTLPLAAHHIALNLSSMPFMVSMGIASASAVQIAQSKSPLTLAKSNLTLISVCMLISASIFLLFRYELAGLYTRDQEVIALTGQLILFAAAFQWVDGLQSVAMGILRGLKREKISMLNTLTAFWLIGVPVSAWLGFHVFAHPRGFWLGLTCGLTAASILHLRAIFLLPQVTQ